MRGGLLVSIALGSTALSVVGCCALAQDRKGIRFWNLTAHTITALHMSPTGEDKWGPDQCKNDRDGTVYHDERLRITGIGPGRYDVRLADKSGRLCIVRNIEVGERGKGIDGLPPLRRAAAGAANPKFAHVMRRVGLRTSGSKAAPEF